MFTSHFGGRAVQAVKPGAALEVTFSSMELKAAAAG
jgi:hypothetical protein